MIEKISKIENGKRIEKNWRFKNEARFSPALKKIPERKKKIGI